MYDNIKEWITYPEQANMKEFGKQKRDAPPTHFALKINSFATLSSSSFKRYESPEFEAAGEKWKLAIYPNGNQARGGKYHISVYLLLADKTCLRLMKEILVTFRLFVFDQINDKYLTGEGVSRFNLLKYEYGFDRFLPLKVFNDATNGYLINDTCMFGAEVFLIQHTNNFKCLSMVSPKSDSFRYTWKIDQFSNMDDKPYFSDKFTVGGYDWKLQLYANGDRKGNGNSISLYLILANTETSVLPAEKQLLVEYKLRLVNQLKQNDMELTATDSFGSPGVGWGLERFFSLTKLKDESNGYLVDDSLIFEADVIVLGATINCV